MIGHGTLTIRDYEVLMSGVGSLTLSNLQAASVTMSGVGEMVATASSNYGYALFPALSGFGGDITSYGAGDAMFPALQSYAEGGLYVPVLTNYGFASFPKMVSSGILGTISYLDGDALFPALMTKGGEGEYGEGAAEFPALVSSGIYDATPFEAKLYNFCYILDAVVARSDYIVVFNSLGSIVDTIEGNKEYIESLIESMTSTGTFTVIGDFIASLNASLATSDDFLATIGTKAALDETARVWVVNMDTGASSQYDDYGFNSLVKNEDTGEYLGFADDGIYRLDGDDDAGEDIDAEIEIGLSHYDTYSTKKILGAHIGLSSDGNMYLVVVADGVTKVYQMLKTSTTMKTQFIPTSHTQLGTYWNFKLLNKDGADFDLAKLDVQLFPISGRI